MAIELAGQHLYSTGAVWWDASGPDIVSGDAAGATVTVHVAEVADRRGLVVGEPFAVGNYVPGGIPYRGASRRRGGVWGCVGLPPPGGSVFAVFFAPEFGVEGSF